MNPLNVSCLIPSIKASPLATSFISLDTTLAGSIIPATTRNPYNGLLGFVSVAGVIGINNTWLRDKGALGSSVDLDTILTPGVYRISSNSFISYKMMVVFKGDTYTVQLFFGIGANDKSLRMSNYYNGE